MYCYCFPISIKYTLDFFNLSQGTKLICTVGNPTLRYKLNLYCCNPANSNQVYTRINATWYIEVHFFFKLYSTIGSLVAGYFFWESLPDQRYPYIVTLGKIKTCILQGRTCFFLSRKYYFLCVTQKLTLYFKKNQSKVKKKRVFTCKKKTIQTSSVYPSKLLVP